jgi:hypothetical protein
MSERTESGEEAVDEYGRNPTQQRMDEEGETAPVDVSWTETPGDGDDLLADDEDEEG